ncbi:MAG: hypothetical protein AAF500_16635 [Myxococcota bacterium]
MRVESTHVDPQGTDRTLIDHDPPTLLVPQPSDATPVAEESRRLRQYLSRLSHLGAFVRALLSSPRFAWALTFLFAATAVIVEHRRAEPLTFHRPSPLAVTGPTSATPLAQTPEEPVTFGPAGLEIAPRVIGSNTSGARSHFTRLLVNNDFEGSLALLRELDPGLFRAGDHQALLTVLAWKTRCRGSAARQRSVCL